MSISKEIREEVQRRAGFACEFCGVTETDTGGELAIGHFQPMKYLVQLAQLWGTSVDEVMKRLGIKPPPAIDSISLNL